MNRAAGRSRVYVAGILAAIILVLGFVAGYGYGFGKNRIVSTPPKPLNTKPGALAPVVKAMRVSPDGKSLAFTGVYDQSRRSSRFIIDLSSRAWSAQESPLGWQDYITQWSSDGRRLMFEREKIPRPAAEAKAGLYELDVAAPSNPISQPKALLDDLDLRDDRIITGFWDARGGLVLKTRREPKALHRVQNGRVVRVDNTPGNYLQNRAVIENRQSVLYVVRTVASGTQSTSSGTTSGASVALYRVASGKAQRLSEPLSDVSWVYVSEDGRWMMTARYAEDGENWRWTLYQVTLQRATKVREAPVSGDVISVYWSPDRKHVLGSSGGSLWIIDVPILRTRQLGKRRDWNADDAAWDADSSSVLVAADGKLFRVSLRDGQERELWRFPLQYWQ